MRKERKKEKSERKRKKEVKLDFSFCFKGRVTGGIEIEILKKKLSLLEKIHQELICEKEKIPFFRLLEENFPQRIKAELPYFRKGKIFLLGIGGSSLGAEAIYRAINFQQEDAFFIFDNIDPEKTIPLLNKIDLSNSLFVVVSKSGKTTETLTNLSILRQRVKLDPSKIIVVTGSGESPLQRLAGKEGYKTFYIPDYIPGRFSLLSPAGLVPLHLAGIDIERIEEGAKFMAGILLERPVNENPAILLASILEEFFTKGKNMLVIMPYSEALLPLVYWFRQLYAESLGKKYKIEGKELSWGQTPVSSLGTVDQHSQLQLYLDGPADKLVFFWEVEEFRLDAEIKDSDLIPFLSGKKLSEVYKIHKRATELALAEKGRPSLTMKIPEIDEFSLGQIIFLLETVVYLIARMIGIEPFDQPAVESIKKLARRLAEAGN